MVGQVLIIFYQGVLATWAEAKVCEWVSEWTCRNPSLAQGLLPSRRIGGLSLLASSQGEGLAKVMPSSIFKSAIILRYLGRGQGQYWEDCQFSVQSKQILSLQDILNVIVCLSLFQKYLGIFSDVQGHHEGHKGSIYTVVGKTKQKEPSLPGLNFPSAKITLVNAPELIRFAWEQSENLFTKLPPGWPPTSCGYLLFRVFVS